MTQLDEAYLDDELIAIPTFSELQDEENRTAKILLDNLVSSVTKTTTAPGQQFRYLDLPAELRLHILGG